jgi:glycosyltransferase involved in cell wall biosynthesis
VTRDLSRSRLAFVTSRYRPHTGGVETHVAELAERFAARGHSVTVHSADAGTTVDGTRLPARERRNGVRVRRHRAFAPGGAVHVAPGVLPAVRRAGYDLVHAHNYHSLPLAFAAAGAREAALVATPHYHGGSADPLRDRLLGPYRAVGRRALGRADAVLAVSEWERDRLRTDLGVDAVVVPNGLDVDRFAAGVPGDRGRAGRPYLLTVGRLEAYKGVQHAIGALTALPSYDLVVAGSGPYRDALARAAREAGVADRVDFRGYVPDADLPDLYAGAAAFLALSSFEAYGMTVAEALAAGTPCVVRETGALVDWAGRADCVGVADDGVEDPSRVAAAVADAVGREAPSDPLPTWESVVDRVADVYAAALADRR